MFWHLSHHLLNKPLASIRLTALYKSVSCGLLCSMSAAMLSPVAYAATMSDTIVASAQHQPLVAVISVSDINAANFSASLANPMVYSQLGLSATDSMSVHFIPTSTTTGTLVISTTQPVSMPFTDVILAINDNGQRNVIPKTLLMPLANSVPIDSPQIIAALQKPDSLDVNNSAAKILTVKREMPPPLFASPSSQIPSLQASRLQMADTKTANIQPQVPMPAEFSTIKVSKAKMRPINAQVPAAIADNSTIQTAVVTGNTTHFDISALLNTSSKIDNKNKLFETLTIQISRRIKLSSPTAVITQPRTLENNTLARAAHPDPLTAQNNSAALNNKPVTPSTEKSSHKVNNTRAKTVVPESSITKSTPPKTTDKSVVPAALSPAQASTLAPIPNARVLDNVMDTDIVSLLQKSRQRTATQAKQTSAPSSSLSVYRKKLQLQNQKRVKLEARFKKLRHQ